MVIRFAKVIRIAFGMWEVAESWTFHIFPFAIIFKHVFQEPKHSLKQYATLRTLGHVAPSQPNHLFSSVVIRIVTGNMEDPADFERPHPIPIEFLVGKFFIAVVFSAAIFVQLLRAVHVFLRSRQSDSEFTSRRAFNRWVVIAAIWVTTSYALEAAVDASVPLRLDRMPFNPNIVVLSQEMFSKLSNVFVGLVVYLLVRLRTKASTEDGSSNQEPLPWKLICTAVPITCWVVLAGPSIIASLFFTPPDDVSLLQAKKMTDTIDMIEHLYFGLYLVMTVTLVTSGVRLWRSLKSTASVSDYDTYDSNVRACFLLG